MSKTERSSFAIILITLIFWNMCVFYTNKHYDFTNEKKVGIEELAHEALNNNIEWIYGKYSIVETIQHIMRK